MKKYYICFFILAALLVAAIFTGTYFYMFRPEPELAFPNGVMESESAPIDNMVINQRLVEKRIMDGDSAIAPETMGLMEEIPLETQTEAAPETQYCLVAEDGFLLVFAKDRYTVCLDTHMPLSEFPETEQQKLLEGIWFSTMLEIFNYLESYSS